MSDRFTIPHPPAGQVHETTLVIRRSRFLTHIAHAATPQEARGVIERVRGRHADATHNCWAYVAGPPGSTARIGASDDGEPHGTAGRPMLNVLLHSGVGEVCAVVTRWFGGIKLGTGGLVRAYQDCVLGGLETLPTKEKVPTLDLLVRAGYADADRVHRLLDRVGAEILDEGYAEDMRLTIRLDADLYPDFTRQLASATDGRAGCAVA